MWRPKFKFGQRLQITGGFYVGRTGVAVTQRFYWKCFDQTYRIVGEQDTAISFNFDAVIQERHLKPAADKVLVVTGQGELKEAR